MKVVNLAVGCFLIGAVHYPTSAEPLAVEVGASEEQVRRVYGHPRSSSICMLRSRNEREGKRWIMQVYTRLSDQALQHESYR